MDIMEEIMLEMYRGKDKHHWPDDMTIVKRAAVLCEEAGETIRAALMHEDEGMDIMDVRREAVHTAAVALRLIESIDDSRCDAIRLKDASCPTCHGVNPEECPDDFHLPF